MSNHNFKELLKEIGELHDKKNKDYGVDVDPYANIRGSSDWGISPWKGAMVRANDKIKRLQKFAQTGELANESVEDSFKDLAVYALIGLDLYRQEQAEPKGTFLGLVEYVAHSKIEGIATKIKVVTDPGNEIRPFNDYEIDLANGVRDWNYDMGGNRTTRIVWADSPT